MAESDQGYPIRTPRLSVILPAETAFYVAGSIHTNTTRYPRCISTEFYKEKTGFFKGYVLHYHAVPRSVTLESHYLTVSCA